MKTISFWLFVFAFTASLARAQDAATQQLIEQINGRIDNLMDMQTAQGKKIADLQKQISDLQEKLNQPAANNYASADDLKKLAQQVQEIDKKRQDDNEQILKTLEKLAKGGGIPTPAHKPPSAAIASDSTSTAATNGNQNGYWQTIGKNDTIVAIAKAYQDKGVKVTVQQILDANPKVDPKNLQIGQKIWIPQPAQ